MVANSNVQSVQLLALTQAAGNELNLYYTWDQFVKEWNFVTVVGTDTYATPSDFKYFTDQTQYDRTNRWPLLGPKSPQEWAWMKGSLVATLPRIRFRMIGDKLVLFPAPTSALNFSMEYTSNDWVLQSSGTYTDYITLDGDTVLYDPWLMIKFIKLKFYELKGFETSGVRADFMRVFKALTGKDKGAEILSLSPQSSSMYIGPWSVPDGSWNVGA